MSCFRSESVSNKVYVLKIYENNFFNVEICILHIGALYFNVLNKNNWFYRVTTQISPRSLRTTSAVALYDRLLLLHISNVEIKCSNVKTKDFCVENIVFTFEALILSLIGSGLKQNICLV